MKLCVLSTGDSVYRYYKSIVIPFQGPRKILSTSVMNGGYREDLTAIFNYDCNPGAGMACTMRADTYEAHMKLIATELGMDAEQTSGMGTAASMDNVAIALETYENLTVTAIVTGGIEVNGGRVGDPATYFKPIDKGMMPKPGTINIMLVIDSDMPPGTLARALVTCTEAKTAALQELMAGSNYSTGLATGSGTDQTIIVANVESPLYLESAGKHSKLGELIGHVVKKTVKEALDKQTGLSPKQQHSVLRRLKRFGVQEEILWNKYIAETSQPKFKPQFLECVYLLDQDSQLLVYTSLYVHLMDQLLWELLLPDEILPVANELLAQVAQYFDCACPSVSKAELSCLVEAWSELIINIIKEKYLC
jgi:adenosylcobinamide hydrolase